MPFSVSMVCFRLIFFDFGFVSFCLVKIEFSPRKGTLITHYDTGEDGVRAWFPVIFSAQSMILRLPPTSALCFN